MDDSCVSYTIGYGGGILVSFESDKIGKFKNGRDRNFKIYKWLEIRWKWTEIGIFYLFHYSNLWSILSSRDHRLGIFRRKRKWKSKGRFFLQFTFEIRSRHRYSDIHFGIGTRFWTTNSDSGNEARFDTWPISLYLYPLGDESFPKDFRSPIHLESSQVSSAFSTKRSCKPSSSRGNPVFVLEIASLFRDGTSHLASLKGAANRRDGGFSGAFQKDSTAETVVPCGLKRQSCLNRVNEL